MKVNGPAIGREAIALITKARSEDDPGRTELLSLAVESLTPREGETLRETLARETQLVAALATIAGALADVIDDVAPPSAGADDALKRLALRWATKLAEEEGGE